jgi:hypothetical protein
LLIAKTSLGTTALPPSQDYKDAQLHERLDGVGDEFPIRVADSDDHLDPKGAYLTYLSLLNHGIRNNLVWVYLVRYKLIQNIGIFYDQVIKVYFTNELSTTLRLLVLLELLII